MLHSVEIVLIPNGASLDVTGPLEVFAAATELLKQHGRMQDGYRPIFAAKEPVPVKFSSGLIVQADVRIGQGKPPDILLIPGGLGIRTVLEDKELIAAIKKRARGAARVVSVCNGAFLLAAAGLLDGKRVTSHWQVAADLAREYPALVVDPDAIFIRDGKISTSAGVCAGIDLALALVEEDYGASLALEVARLLVVYFRRAGGQSQFSAPLKARQKAGACFGQLHDWMLDHLSGPLTVEQLAEKARMSQRNFARVFLEKTGITPSKYVEMLRLDRARELLESGDDSMQAVAEASGFGREERMRSAFYRHLSVSPAHYRIHFSNGGLLDAGSGSSAMVSAVVR